MQSLSPASYQEKCQHNKRKDYFSLESIEKQGDIIYFKLPAVLKMYESCKQTIYF